jgi:hypothetical protein
MGVCASCCAGSSHSPHVTPLSSFAVVDELFPLVRSAPPTRPPQFKLVFEPISTSISHATSSYDTLQHRCVFPHLSLDFRNTSLPYPPRGRTVILQLPRRKLEVPGRASSVGQRAGSCGGSFAVPRECVSSPLFKLLSPSFANSLSPHRPRRNQFLHRRSSTSSLDSQLLGER